MLRSLRGAALLNARTWPPVATIGDRRAAIGDDSPPTRRNIFDATWTDSSILAVHHRGSWRRTAESAT